MTHNGQTPASMETVAKRPQAGLGAGTLLVAVDFSETSEAALLWACGYADRTGAGLEVLHVLHDPLDAPGLYKSGNGDALAPMADVAHGLIAQFMDRNRRDHPDAGPLESARMLVRKGLPADTIVDVAEELGADLVIMGSRGRNVVQRLLLGSTAARVLALSPIPVTVVKSRQHA